MDWQLWGFFSGSMFEFYVAMKGFRTGTVTMYINRKKRMFNQNDRHFKFVIAMHFIFSFLAFAGGICLFLVRYVFK